MPSDGTVFLGGVPRAEALAAVRAATCEVTRRHDEKYWLRHAAEDRRRRSRYGRWRTAA